MNTQKVYKVLAGLVVLIGVVYVGVSYPKDNTVVQQVAQQFGSSSGPDRFNPCESTNGITSCFNKVSLKQATTTICSIVSPPATSTLVFASLHMNVATTGGATTLTFAKAVFGATASTSLITAMNVAVGSGAEANAVASSSMVFAPSTMFNVTQAGGGSFIGGTFSETGFCQATFTQLI